MKLSNFSRKVVFTVLATVVAGAGLTASFAQTNKAPATAPAPAATGPATATAPTGPNPVIASIGNSGLQRDDMVNILLAVGGLQIFDQYWGFAVVMQAVDGAGITVKPEDVQRIKDQLIAKLPAAQGKTLTKEEKDQIIFNALVQRGITTKPQIDWYFGTYAGLQLLAERVAAKDVTPTPEDFARAKAATFGERAVVYDFQVKDEVEGAEVVGQLDKKIKPEVIAQKHRCQGVTVARQDEGVAQVFRDEIWKVLKSEPGKFSSKALQDPKNKSFHVIFLQNIEAARIPTKEEETKLQEAVTEQKAAAWRTQHLNRLKLMSIPNVRISDPILANQFGAMVEQIRRQAEAASTQSGLSPATATAPATEPMPK